MHAVSTLRAWGLDWKTLVKRRLSVLHECEPSLSSHAFCHHSRTASTFPLPISSHFAHFRMHALCTSPRVCRHSCICMTIESGTVRVVREILGFCEAYDLGMWHRPGGCATFWTGRPRGCMQHDGYANARWCFRRALKGRGRAVLAECRVTTASK